MTPEKQFENRIKRYFHSVGVYPAGYAADRQTAERTGWYVKVWGGGYQKAGVPDILACVNGFFMAVEVKAARGRPSELQKLNIRAINRSGGIGVILYPDGFRDFTKLTEGLLACNTHTHGLNVLRSALTSTNCDTLTD